MQRIVTKCRVQTDDYPVGNKSEYEINEEDWKQLPQDILDLQTISDQFATRRNAFKMLLSGFTKKKYRPMTDEVYQEMIANDKLLRRVYNTYYTRKISSSPDLKEKFKKMIHRLEKKPHLYSPYERSESTFTHVTRWLVTSTSDPEPEMVGFTSRCPLEPIRFIPSVAPRATNSDIGINLFTEHKQFDSMETGHTHGRYALFKSSSDTRLVVKNSLYNHTLKLRIIPPRKRSTFRF